MRTITGDDGELWDVAVQQASYGAHCLLFAARGGSEIRRAPMAASNQIDAGRELADLSDDELRELLREATGRDDPFDPSA